MDWVTWSQIMLMMLWATLLASWLISALKTPYRDPKERTHGPR